MLFLREPLETRAIALAHEREHIMARDRLLSLFALVLLIVMPWNPALHWQVRRLRLAIEVDCDARVVYQRRTISCFCLHRSSSAALSRRQAPETIIVNARSEITS